MHIQRPLHSLLTAILVAVLTLFTFAPAQAATLTARMGVGFGDDEGSGYVGTYVLSDGTSGYCLDIERNSPIGESYDFATDTSAQTVAQRRQINYILQKWGTTNLKRQAFAVQWAIWKIASTDAEWNSHQWLWNVVPASLEDEVRAMFTSYLAEARERAVESVNASVEIEYTAGQREARVTSVLTTTMLNGQTRPLANGTHTGSLTITGGHWRGGATSTTAANGATLIAEVPANTGLRDFHVTASFANLPYSSRLKVSVPSVDGSLQRLLIAQPASVSVAANAQAQWDVRTRFAPYVDTVAMTTEGDGDVRHIADRLTVGVAPTPDNPTGRWGVTDDGRPIPVTIVSTLYGPLDESPTLNANVPEDAPVVGSVRNTVTGPGTVITDALTVTEPGYFTWVSELDVAAAPAASRGYIAPWRSSFGIPAETTLTRWSPQVATVTSDARAQVGTPLSDTLTVTGNRPGNELEVISTLYGPFDTRPEHAAADDHRDGGAVIAPENAPIAGSVTTTIVGNGGFETEPIVVSSAGYYVWTETIEETPETLPWRSSFAQIEETTIVPWTPAIDTRVSSTAVLIGEQVSDAVRVTGLPESFGAAGIDEPTRITLTMYGPLPDRPAQAATIPVDAPVFGIREVLISPVDEGYGATSEPFDEFTEPGYYTIVAEIAEGERTTAYRSDFGEPSETVLVSAVVLPTGDVVELANTGAAGGMWAMLGLSTVLGGTTLMAVAAFRRRR